MLRSFTFQWDDSFVQETMGLTLRIVDFVGNLFSFQIAPVPHPLTVEIIVLLNTTDISMTRNSLTIYYYDGDR